LVHGLKRKIVAEGVETERQPGLLIAVAPLDRNHVRFAGLFKETVLF